jgi:hypothetical protein
VRSTLPHGSGQGYQPQWSNDQQGTYGAPNVHLGPSLGLLGTFWSLAQRNSRSKQFTSIKFPYLSPLWWVEFTEKHLFKIDSPGNFLHDTKRINSRYYLFDCVAIASTDRLDQDR